MPKIKSLLDGIGNENVTEKYYDNWAINYDQTLKKWNYKAPKKAVKTNGFLMISFSEPIFSECLAPKWSQKGSPKTSGLGKMAS